MTKKITEEGTRIKAMRTNTGLSQQKFGEIFGIPSMNIANWEQGLAKPPKYVVDMIERIFKLEAELKSLKEPKAETVAD